MIENRASYCIWVHIHEEYFIQILNIILPLPPFHTSAANNTFNKPAFIAASLSLWCWLQVYDLSCGLLSANFTLSQIYSNFPLWFVNDRSVVSQWFIPIAKPEVAWCIVWYVGNRIPQWIVILCMVFIVSTQLLSPHNYCSVAYMMIRKSWLESRLLWYHWGTTISIFWSELEESI